MEPFLLQTYKKNHMIGMCYINVLLCIVQILYFELLNALIY